MANPFRAALSKIGVMSASKPAQSADAVVSLQGGGIASRVTTAFEGASLSRRMSPFIPNRAHLNSILSSEAPMLRARIRQLISNTAYGASASETFVSYATGTGIKPSPLLDNPGQKKAVTQAWADWTDEADADGLTDFYGLQSLAARALFDAGEVFIRFRDRRPEDGLSVPLQLQLIEADQLDIAYTTYAQNGNVIRCGIEFDAIGRRQAYWFWKAHPGDGTVINVNTMERVRVPADQVIHIYKPLRPGQIRGKPWLTAGMVTLYDLDQYTDAEMMRKKGAAMYMAAITKELKAGDIEDTGLVDETMSSVDTSGAIEFGMEPGSVPVLPEGWDMKFNNPADVGPNYEAFMYRKLLELCAAMGLPYFSVTGDTSKANYSSIRSALLDLKRRVEQFQWEVLVFQMCRRVYVRWLDAAVLAGTVRLPGYAVNAVNYRRVKWITPKWDWVDPLKDAQAEKLMVDAGFKPRSTVVEATGEDAEQNDEIIAADHAREKKLGLDFAVGFKKAPDASTGQSDIQQEGGGENTGAQAAEDEPPEEEIVDKIVTAVWGNAPPPLATRTVVTKHDAQGRILEFEKHPILDRKAS